MTAWGRPNACVGAPTGYDFETMIIRQGAQGALVVHDDRIYGQPVFDTEAIDAIGRATPSPARFFPLASTVTIS